MLPLLLALAACTDNSLVANDVAGAELAPLPGTLRIDVVPPAGLGSPQLLPQSTLVQASEYEGVSIALAPTILFSGLLESDVTQDWHSAVGVPTTVSPLVATITASLPETPLGASVQSEESGSFALAIPAYPDDTYTITMVPADASAAPVHRERRVFRADTVENFEFALGIPVSGRVTDAAGNGLPNVPLRVLADDGTIASSTFFTDDSGWYVARVESPGDYAIEVEGGPTDSTRTVVPTIRQAVSVTGEDVDDGVAASIDVGTLGDVRVEGTVTDADGHLVPNARVRLTSTSLTGSAGSLTIEKDAEDGTFFRRVLAGTYDVEVIPPFDVPGTPITVPGVVVTEDVDLSFELPAQASFAGTVFDSEGNPAPDVLITAKEVGYDHYVYQARTDAQGAFAVSVPDTDYEIVLTPPSVSVPGALTRTYSSPGADHVFQLEAGEVLDGALTFEDKAVGWALLEVYDATTGDLVGRGTTNEAGNFSMRVHVDADTTADTGGADTAAE